MTSVSQAKQRKPIETSSFGQTQQLMGELPGMFRQLQKQTAYLQQAAKEQLAETKKQTQLMHQQSVSLERIHDRLEAVAVESRVTNVLLSELVAVHQTIVSEDTEIRREIIRNNAYTRVLNGG